MLWTIPIARIFCFLSQIKKIKFNLILDLKKQIDSFFVLLKEKQNKNESCE